MKQEAFCVETQTMANKGQAVLMRKGFTVYVRRSDCGQNGSCAFELLVPLSQAQEAQAALAAENVTVLRRRVI